MPIHGLSSQDLPLPLHGAASVLARDGNVSIHSTSNRTIRRRESRALAKQMKSSSNAEKDRTHEEIEARLSAIKPVL